MQKSFKRVSSLNGVRIALMVLSAGGLIALAAISMTDSLSTNRQLSLHFNYAINKYKTICELSSQPLAFDRDAKADIRRQGADYGRDARQSAHAANPIVHPSAGCEG